MKQVEHSAWLVFNQVVSISLEKKMHSRRQENRSQSVKAVQLRNLRIKRANDRRFNKPLRSFLEHKYPEIFKEYVNLYQAMDTAHPDRKKLSTSTTFRQWMAVNPPVSTSQNILTKPLQETFPAETGQKVITEQTGPGQSTQSKTNQELPLLDNADIENNTLQQDSPQQVESLQQQLDNIINELVMDEDLHDVLNQPVPAEDEGIELNPHDEILGDILDFDYAREVEPFHF